MKKKEKKKVWESSLWPEAENKKIKKTEPNDDYEMKPVHIGYCNQVIICGISLGELKQFF